MEDAKDRNLRKSVKNLYDLNTGLPIMINLYVIKYIYYHIRKDIRFIEKRQRGKKDKSYPIYQNELPMSRQRFDRINKGMTFEITSKEAQDITERFGIDIKYFRKYDPVMFEIEGINLGDWKCFYNHNYNNGYSLSGIRTKDYVAKRSDFVEHTLNALCNDWERKLDESNPLFAICYYFYYGKRLNDSNKIKQLMELVQKIDYSEWESERTELLKNDYDILRKHCEYINSLVTIRELHSEN